MHLLDNVQVTRNYHLQNSRRLSKYEDEHENGDGLSPSPSFSTVGRDMSTISLSPQRTRKRTLTGDTTLDSVRARKQSALFKTTFLDTEMLHDQSATIVQNWFRFNIVPYRERKAATRLQAWIRERLAGAAAFREHLFEVIDAALLALDLRAVA